MKKKIFISLALCLTYLFMFSADVMAANFASEVQDKLQSITDGWSSALQGAALSLFKLTLILELGLFGIRIALKRTPIQETIGEFVMLLMFAGFIAAVILNYAEWSQNIVYGLEQWGFNNLSFSKTNVGSPSAYAASICQGIINKAQSLTGIDGFVQCFMMLGTAALVTICFMLVTGILLVVKAEFLIISNIGLLIIGLGGSKIFKEYAINVMKYVFSVGVKLLVLNCVVFLGMELFQGLHLETHFASDVDLYLTYSGLILAIACSVLLVVLAWILPSTVSGLLQGVQIHGGNVLGNAMVSAGRGAVNSLASAGRSIGGAARTGATNLGLANQAASLQGTSGLTDRVQKIGSNLSQAYEDAKSAKLNPNTVQGQLQSQVQSARANKDLDSRLNSQQGGQNNAGSLQSQLATPQGSSAQNFPSSQESNRLATSASSGQLNNSSSSFFNKSKLS
jgi:type IV secretion system protein TrbL